MVVSFQPVEFDTEGSLELARALWRMSEDLDAVASARDTDIESASKDWKGPHGDDFRKRATEESDDFTVSSRSLRRAANSWAGAWVEATDENRRREYEAAVDEERNSRSIGEQFFDNFVGDDSAVEVGPAPLPVTKPVGPDFNPTV